MASDKLGIVVEGRLLITDDLGNVLLDKTNAVHPQNLARVFARGLSNEDNYKIHRIAIGDGGTITDAAFNVSYRTPNDGQPPDVRTWDSRLYNEIYSEIIDEGTVDDPNELGNTLGTDPGSAGPNVGTRPGGGAVPESDPPSTPNISGPGVRSIEDGLISRVVITSVLNPDEPSDYTDDFTFDEIGLYNTGAAAIDSTGYHSIGYGDKNSESDTGLSAGTPYSFRLTVDGVFQQILLTPPLSGGSGTGNEFLYGDLCEALNTGDIAWNSSWPSTASPMGQARVSITDDTTSFPSITGAKTNGFLKFESGSSGSGSDVCVNHDANPGLSPGDPGYIQPLGFDLLTALGISIESPPQECAGEGIPVDGVNAGLQNDPVESHLERERLLTHLIFEPVTRPVGRQLTFTYTLLLSVARSSQ